MKDWQKDRNYRKIRQSGGKYKYIVTIDQENIEVSKEVYEVYSQADRRERYCAERESGLLISLEQFNLDCMAFPQLNEESHIVSVEDMALRRLAVEEMTAAFNLLNAEDKFILASLVMDKMPERDCAAIIGMSQKGVNKRKKRALKKVLKIMVLKQADFRE